MRPLGYVVLVAIALVVAVLVGVAFFLAFGWLATWRIIGNSPQLRDVVPRRGKCAPMESNNAVCNLQVPRARNIKSNRRATEFADDANSRQCKIAEETRDKITEIYVCSLQKKLIRCWEIEERFRSGFKSAVESYKPPSSGSQFVQLPQIPRLDEECHNFLYEMKNYVRDLLNVLNRLYGTDFKEASEFFQAKKGSKSLIEFAVSAFGRDNPKTKFLEEVVGEVERVVKFRNAVEHPGGYSGELRIMNFALEPDGSIWEPTWFLEKDGTRVTNPSVIRADMERALHNFLVLGESVVVSWAADNLKAGEWARVAVVPEERRDPSCPIKYVVTASRELEELLQRAESNSQESKEGPSAAR